MRSINEVTILGNLTRDPDLRKTQGGKSVVSFSVATNREWYDKESQEKKEAVDYHNVVFWGKPAELIDQYSQKGSKILVKGRLQTRSYEDKEGNKKYVTEIIGSDFVFLGGGREESKQVEEETQEEIRDDEVPF